MLPSLPLLNSGEVEHFLNLQRRLYSEVRAARLFWRAPLWLWGILWLPLSAQAFSRAASTAHPKTICCSRCCCCFACSRSALLSPVLMCPVSAR